MARHRWLALSVLCFGVVVSAAATVSVSGAGLDGSTDGYPLALRFGALANIPPVHVVVRWSGGRHAGADYARGVRRLYGLGQGGTYFMGTSRCDVSKYERDLFRSSDVPAWSQSGLTGTVTLSCNGVSGDTTALNFTVVEFGCIVENPQAGFAQGYNQAMVRRAFAAAW